MEFLALLNVTALFAYLALQLGLWLERRQLAKYLEEKF